MAHTLERRRECADTQADLHGIRGGQLYIPSIYLQLYLQAPQANFYEVHHRNPCNFYRLFNAWTNRILNIYSRNQLLDFVGV